MGCAVLWTHQLSARIWVWRIRRAGGRRRGEGEVLGSQLHDRRWVGQGGDTVVIRMGGKYCMSGQKGTVVSSSLLWTAPILA